MLEMNAIFSQKATEFPLMRCKVEKVVELSSDDFLDFLNSPLANRNFIEENIDLMCQDDDGIFHCLLVLGKNLPDGVLIESSGYSYARFSSYIPQARILVDQELLNENQETICTPEDEPTITI